MLFEILFVVAFILLIGVLVYLKIIIKEKTKLQKEIESWVRDQLTGLLSRRMFMECYMSAFNVVHCLKYDVGDKRRMIDKSARIVGNGEQEVHIVSRELTLVFLDLDHFKNVNDSYGHAMGDVVLQKFGSLVNGFVRNGDLAGRHGGEEFILAIKGDKFSAEAIVKRLRRAFQQVEFNFEGKIFKVTFSAGIVELDNQDYNYASLIDEADKAVYKAKDEGRDCYVLLENGEYKISRD